MRSTEQAAYVARELAPARVTAIDSSPTQHARALERHGHLPNLELVQADAAAHLHERPTTFDVCFSLFGALDFTDPHVLLPAIAEALTPEGVLVFSTLAHYHSGHAPEPEVRPAQIPARTVDGTRTTMDRWVLEARLWEQLLAASGFMAIDTFTVRDPGSDEERPVATNIFRAARRPASL
ncbi:class I SAM-dependent methyltransferase [Streptomyces sp. NPDC021622]|uniref:class I SAM-dependent methyltransferase n=1 Tax=Streptomyces sp. NPDC021622 TaxID=3155013 RepID=UPI0033C5A878